MTATKAPGATPTPILTTSGPQSTTKAPGATPTPTPTTSGPPPQAKGLPLGVQYNYQVHQEGICVYPGNTTYLTQCVVHDLLLLLPSPSLLLPPPPSAFLHDIGLRSKLVVARKPIFRLTACNELTTSEGGGQECMTIHPSPYRLRTTHQLSLHPFRSNQTSVNTISSSVEPEPFKKQPKIQGHH